MNLWCLIPLRECIRMHDLYSNALLKYYTGSWMVLLQSNTPLFRVFCSSQRTGNVLYSLRIHRYRDRAQFPMKEFMFKSSSNVLKVLDREGEERKREMTGAITIWRNARLRVLVCKALTVVRDIQTHTHALRVTYVCIFIFSFTR